MSGREFAQRVTGDTEFTVALSYFSIFFGKFTAGLAVTAGLIKKLIVGTLQIFTGLIELSASAARIGFGGDPDALAEEYFRTEKKDRFLGNVEVWRSTKDISKEDLSVCIDRFKRWAATERIYIPDQEDKARLRDVEMEMARARTWL